MAPKGEPSWIWANFLYYKLEHKEEHTLADCKPCHDDHFMLQTKFPQGPYFELPQPILTIKMDEMKQLGKSITTRKVFSELNSFSVTFGQNFRCYSKGQRGTFTDETNTERKKEKASVDIQKMSRQREQVSSKNSCNSCACRRPLNAFIPTKENAPMLWNTSI